MIIVDLITATICFSGSCYPALVGPDTPRGEFSLVQRITSQEGYGGDVLQFHETKDAWYAVHRVWAERPSERRIRRLHSDDPAQRRTITKGCINVMPDVYEKLKACCTNEHIQIK
jgi:hypothetical protein